ncbi:MAG: N-acetylmuramoyl-L-alanine amidase [Lawsonella sp.]
MTKPHDHAPSAEVRKQLVDLGFVINPDDDLGTAIRAFQQQRGLVVDGWVGPMTKRALKEAGHQLGSRVLNFIPTNVMFGDDVAALQESLQELGFYTSRIDGVFGSSTHIALLNYQRDFGLASDGICGPATLQSLSRLGRRITGGSPSAIMEQEVVRRSGPRLSGKRIILNPNFTNTTNSEYSALLGEDLREPHDEIVWDIANRIEGRMTALGVESFITHPRGSDIDADKAAEMANRVDGDIVITLECDVYPNDKANGCATFFFGNGEGKVSAVGQLLAEFINREIVARTGLTDCRSHGRTWDVLRLTRMPSVSVSMGYITNPDDRALLLDPEARDRIAEAIVVAVKRLYLMNEDTLSTGSFTFAELLEVEKNGTA